MERLYLSEFPGTGYRVRLVKEDSLIGQDSKDVSPVSNAMDVYKYIRTGLENKDREFFVTILLNVKNVPMGVNLVSIGNLNSATVHPREVYKAAILASAAGIILVHNHPSGDPTPSREDINITSVLQKAGEILNIPVYDHIIVGRDNWRSLRESGDLSFNPVINKIKEAKQNGKISITS